MAIILGGLIAAVLIINAILISSAAGRLEEKIAAIRSAGDPVALMDLATPPPPAEENAAVFLRRAERDFEALSKELYEVFGRDGFIEGQLEPKDFDAIRAAFEAYPNLVPMLERAAEAPAYDPQQDYTVDVQTFLADLLNAMQAKQVIRVLAARAHLSASDGDHEEALRTCLTMFRLCHHFDEVPTLISHLVALACRSATVSATNAVLRAGPIPREVREMLDAELARQADSVDYAKALKTERVVGLENFRMYLNHVVYWPVRAAFLNDASAYLELVDRHLQLIDRSYRDCLAAEREIQQDASLLHPLTSLVRPALMRGRLATDRVRSLLRCLRVLNATQDHLERTGAKSVSLEDLGLPAEATIDPFTFEPLKLEERDRGWIVWSVGENFRDDGGRLENNLDVGVGPIRPTTDNSPASSDQVSR